MNRMIISLALATNLAVGVISPYQHRTPARPRHLLYLVRNRRQQRATARSRTLATGAAPGGMDTLPGGDAWSVGHFLPISIRLPRSASKRVQMKSAGATPNCRFRSKRAVSKTLAYQRAYDAAWQRLHPGMQRVNLPGPTRLPAQPACRAMGTGWPYS